MTYRVEGFTFETEEEARLAGKEAEGIKYIRTQNNMNDTDTVLKLYNRLIEKEVFTTPVGIAFLEELRSYLVTVPYIRRRDLLPLPVYAPAQTGEETEGETGTSKAIAARDIMCRRGQDYYKPFVVSTFLAVVFAAALIGIFIIMAISSNNVTILNYENQLIDRYERWEKDLVRRENELKEKEQQLQLQQQQEDTQWTN